MQLELCAIFPSFEHRVLYWEISNLELVCPMLSFLIGQLFLSKEKLDDIVSNLLKY